METNTSTATAQRAVTFTLTVTTNVDLDKHLATLASDLARVTSYEADESPYDEDDFYGDFIKPLAHGMEEDALERDFQIRLLVETAVEDYLRRNGEVVEFTVSCEVDEARQDFDSDLADEFFHQHPYPTA